MFNLFLKKKITQSAQQTFKNLNQICKKMVAENRFHTSQIILLEVVLKSENA